MNLSWHPASGNRKDPGIPSGHPNIVVPGGHECIDPSGNLGRYWPGHCRNGRNSAIFSGKLKWNRRLFLFPYVILSFIFLVLFVLLNDIPVLEYLRHNLFWGILAGVLASGVLIMNIRSQQKSQTLKGRMLMLDLIWLGLLYGLTDGLVLNVMPVIAVKEMFGGLDAANGFGGLLLIGIIGLGSSLFLALLYHLGYKEYRNKSVLFVLIGNTIITLAFIVSDNMFGAIISHTVMHLAAVIRGPETTIQLPPHYVG